MKISQTGHGWHHHPTEAPPPWPTGFHCCLIKKKKKKQKDDEVYTKASRLQLLECPWSLGCPRVRTAWTSCLEEAGCTKTAALPSELYGIHTSGRNCTGAHLLRGRKKWRVSHYVMQLELVLFLMLWRNADVPAFHFCSWEGNLFRSSNSDPRK